MKEIYETKRRKIENERGVFVWNTKLGWCLEEIKEKKRVRRSILESIDEVGGDRRRGNNRGVGGCAICVCWEFIVVKLFNVSWS